MASQFTTAARVKAHLGIPSGVTTHDTRVGYAVDAVDPLLLPLLGLNAITGSVTQQWYTDRIDVPGPAEDAVPLSRLPVVSGSVAAVTDDGGLVAATDYYVDNEAGEVRLTGAGSYFTQGRQKVVVTYQAGYASVPGDLQLCGDAIGAWAFNQLPRAGFESEKAGDYSVDVVPAAASMAETDLPPIVRRLLANYRRALR